MIIILTVAVVAFVQPTRLATRRCERRLADDDYDDFDFDAAYRQRVSQMDPTTEQPKQNLIETALLGAAGVGGSVVAVGAAIAALCIGIYLNGLYSPLREQPAPPEPEPGFYIIPSNKPIV